MTPAEVERRIAPAAGAAAGLRSAGSRQADDRLDSGILFDRSNKAADGLDMGAKVGANMRSSQASPSDVGRTLSQVDAATADTERRPATG